MHLRQPDRARPRAPISGLLPEGVVVVIGAGPMGRMHVDLAISARPRAIIVSARRDERLAWMHSTFGARAAAAGAELVTVNVLDDDLAAVVARVADGRGADDVIVTVADGAVVADAQHLLARHGVLDLCAGLPPDGAMVAIDGRAVHYGEINITGSSGGGPWDIIEALRLMAAGEVEPAAHIAHVGDLSHTPQLLQMARDGQVKISPPSRPSVRWKGEAPPSIGTCCLANSLRDTGQSREPEPPQRIAGTIRPWVEALTVPGMGDKDVNWRTPSETRLDSLKPGRAGAGNSRSKLARLPRESNRNRSARTLPDRRR
jgi:hypothetical protein